VPHVIPARQAWHRLDACNAWSLTTQLLAWAVSFMPLSDQLDLTLELLHQVENTYLDDEEPGESLPPNVIRLRLRRPR